MRINVGIPVKNLSDEYLRAEEAEIAMCPGFYNRVWKGKSSIPSQFTLGKGHISFFMNKKTWTFSSAIVLLSFVLVIYFVSLR